MEVGVEFYPIMTDDGTLSLFNIDIEDVYHSVIGAYTEALGKYVNPSGIKEFAKSNNSVKILDVCYGLGYNSKVAVSEILKVNSDIDIKIVAVEIDPIVVAFSAIVGSEIFDEKLNSRFFDEISRHVDIQQLVDEQIEKMTENAHKIMPIIQNKLVGGGTFIPPDNLRLFLHNIYYRTISTRKSIDMDLSQMRLNINYYVEDARQALRKLANSNELFDFVFFDPFTPAKVPMLWTVEIFNMLFRLLNENGNITTYSNAAPVRAGLVEAGFYLGQTTPLGKKSSGTIAYKNPAIVKTPLSDKEYGLLETKAGIPYRDPTLISTNEEILSKRAEEQNASDRISTSSYLTQVEN